MDKNLIAYAYLAQTKRNDGDLVSGLMPIFKPLAKELAGKIFDPHQFVELAKKNFGLKVNPLVAQDLKPRLESAGIIERKYLTKTEFEHIYSEISNEFNEIKEENIENLLNNFCDYINKNAKILEDETTEDHAKSFFIDYITDLEFAKKYLYTGKKSKQTKDKTGKFGKVLTLKKTETEEEKEEVEEANSNEEEFRTNSKLAKLSSSYIYDAKENNKEIFDLIIKICAGSLVSEAVLNFQNPQTDVSLKNVYCILDTPFLMSVLDLSEKDRTESARLILDTLKSNGARIAIYNHTLEELSINLEGVRQHFESGQGYRATARRLNQREFKEWFDEVRMRPENVLKHNGIEVLRSTTKNLGASSYSFFSEDQEQVLYGKLTHVENPAARDKDVMSIAETVRRRGGVVAGSNDITAAKVIFITGNTQLAQRSKKFCVHEGIYGEKDFPPAVTDKYMAGLLWVLFGGAAENLPKLALLANCASTLEPNNETAIKMLDLLGNLDESKASYFKALMTSDRACHYLAVVSLDGPESIDKNNIGEVLENMEAEFSAKFNKEKEDLIQQHREEKKKIKEETEESINEIKSASTAEINKLKFKHENLKSNSESQNEKLNFLNSALENMQRQLEDEKKAALKKEIAKAKNCLKESIKKYRKSKLIIHIAAGLTLIVISPLAVGFTTSSVLAQVLSTIPGGIVAACSFWEAPKGIFDSRLKKNRIRNFEKLLKERDIDLDPSQINIDWEKGVLDFVPES